MKKTLLTISLAAFGALYSQNIAFDKLYGNSDPVNYYLGHYPVSGSDGLDINWYGGIRLRTTGGLVQLLNNGNLGIGTETPQQKLEVNNGFITSRISDYAISPTNKVGFLINELGTNIFDISYARDGLGTLKMKTFFSNPITFGTNNTERMRINAAGDIGIGTDSPIYKLDVVGDAQFRDFISGGSNSWIFHTPDDGRKTLHIAYGSPGAWEWGKAFVLSGDTGNAALQGKLEAKEVKVTLTPTADFVFEEDYNLPKLEDVEKHIKNKKHLPEIPSAKEMEKNGVNIGEFQIKLLQKIEELTLYQIQMNKEIRDLKQENIALKKLISK